LRLFELTEKLRAHGGSHVTERHIITRICHKYSPYFSNFSYTRIALYSPRMRNVHYFLYRYSFRRSYSVIFTFA